VYNGVFLPPAMRHAQTTHWQQLLGPLAEVIDQRASMHGVMLSQCAAGQLSHFDACIFNRDGLPLLAVRPTHGILRNKQSLTHQMSQTDESDESPPAARTTAHTCLQQHVCYSSPVDRNCTATL
jgi:hypothetical protein